jgi:hypothetical protein
LHLSRIHVRFWRNVSYTPDEKSSDFALGIDTARS